MAKLKRDLGVWGAASIGIGAIIGTGIFCTYTQRNTKGVISLPSRYIHTPVSVVNLEDMENTVKLILAVINNIK